MLHIPGGVEEVVIMSHHAVVLMGKSAIRLQLLKMERSLLKEAAMRAFPVAKWEKRGRDEKQDSDKTK